MPSELSPGKIHREEDNQEDLYSENHSDAEASLPAVIAHNQQEHVNHTFGDQYAPEPQNFEEEHQDHNGFTQNTDETNSFSQSQSIGEPFGLSVDSGKSNGSADHGNIFSSSPQSDEPAQLRGEEDDFWGSQAQHPTLESGIPEDSGPLDTRQVPDEVSNDKNSHPIFETEDASEDDFAKFIQQKTAEAEQKSAVATDATNSASPFSTNDAATEQKGLSTQKHKRKISVFESAETDPFFSNLSRVQEHEEEDEDQDYGQDTSYEDNAFTGASTIDKEALQQNATSSLDSNPFESSSEPRKLSFLEEDNDFLDDEEELVPTQPATVTEPNRYAPGSQQQSQQPLRNIASTATITGYNTGYSGQEQQSMYAPVSAAPGPAPAVTTNKQLNASKSMYFGQNLGNSGSTAKTNAFDLPGNIMPKHTMRPAPSVQNFHSQPAQFMPPHTLQSQQSMSSMYSRPGQAGGIQGSGGPPPKSLTSQRSFFEELPSLPKKPLNRKQSHMADMGSPPVSGGPGMAGGALGQFGGYQPSPGMGASVPPPRAMAGQQAPPPLQHQSSQAFGGSGQYQPGGQNFHGAPNYGARRPSSSTGSSYEPIYSHSRNSSGSYSQDFALQSPYTPQNQTVTPFSKPANPYEPQHQQQPQQPNQMVSPGPMYQQAGYAQPPLNHSQSQAGLLSPNNRYAPPVAGGAIGASMTQSKNVSPLPVNNAYAPVQQQQQFQYQNQPASQHQSQVHAQYQNSLYSPPVQTARTYLPYETQPNAYAAGPATGPASPRANQYSPQLNNGLDHHLVTGSSRTDSMDSMGASRNTAPPASSTYGDLTPDLASSARRAALYSPPMNKTALPGPPAQRDPSQPVSLNFEQARKIHSSSIPVVAPAAAPVDPAALMKRQFPLFSWGNGKTVLVGIPPPIAYGSVSRMDLRVIKQVDMPQSEESILMSKFPAPLVGAKGVTKSKKKELEKWMEEKIESLRQVHGQAHPPDDRRTHRLLLWQLLDILLKADAHLSKIGPDTMKSINELLDPNSAYRKERLPNISAQYTSGSDLYGQQRTHMRHPTSTSSTSNEFGSQELKELFQYIQAGDRESGLRVALDKKLWGHALVIAGSLGPGSWNNAVSEFVREEVRRESIPEAKSLALLYRVFAGAGSDSLTEVAPPIGPHGERAYDNLGNWREYLSLILSNRSSNDKEAIVELGRLLLNAGFVEAGHVCFILSDYAIFGSPEEPSISLVGSSRFGGIKDADSILMSEVYEFLLLSNPPPNVSNVVSNFAHLIPYKIHHCMLLADYGYVSEAQKLLEVLPAMIKRGGAINTPGSSANSGSLNSRLASMIDDLAHRLAVTDDSAGGWFGGKLGKNKQWMQSFNKFVSGGEEESDVPPTSEGDSIFKRLASTPASDIGTELPMGPSGGVFTPGVNANMPPLMRQPSLQQMPGLSRVQSHNPMSSLPSVGQSDLLNRAHSTTNMSAMNVQMQPSGHNPYAPLQPLTTGRRSSASEKHTSPNPSRRSSGIQNDDIYAIGIAGTSSRPTSRSAIRPFTPDHQVHSQANSSVNNSPGYGLGTNGGGGTNLYDVKRAPSASSGTYNPYAPTAPVQASPIAPNPYQPIKSTNSSLDLGPQPESGPIPPSSNPYGMIYGSSVNSTSTSATKTTAYESAYSAGSSEGGEDDRRHSVVRSSIDEQEDEEEEEEMFDPEAGEESGTGFGMPGVEQYQSPNWSAPTFATNTALGGAPAPAAYGTPVIPEEEEDEEDLGISNSKKDPEAEKKKKAEAEKKAQEAEAAKAKGWFKGWFKGGSPASDDGKPKAIKAKLGEERSLVYDKELKRWVDKNAPPEDLKPLAPPAPPKSKSAIPMGASVTSPQPQNSMPYGGGPTGPGAALSMPVTPVQQGTPNMPTPVNRPSTTTPSGKASGTSGGIDDLLASAGTGRKVGRRSARGRYVDVFNTTNQ